MERAAVFYPKVLLSKPFQQRCFHPCGIGIFLRRILFFRLIQKVCAVQTERKAVQGPSDAASWVCRIGEIKGFLSGFLTRLR